MKQENRIEEFEADNLAKDLEENAFAQANSAFQGGSIAPSEAIKIYAKVASDLAIKIISSKEELDKEPIEKVVRI